MTAAGLYIHVPFCRRRCPYCGFAAESGRESLLPRYVEAVVAEVHRRRGELAGPLGSVFFGGGTPSLLTPSQIAMILSAVRGGTPTGAELEITLEANPGAVAARQLAGFRRCGVNRLSLGLLDPYSRQPGFKQCAVKIEAAQDQQGAALLNRTARTY